MKDVKEKFRNIDIWSFDGKGDINNILKFQSIFNITLPNTYRELMTRYNNPKFEQDTFDFYDPYHERESLASFGFDGFNSQYENIYNQFIGWVCHYSALIQMEYPLFSYIAICA